MKKTHSYIIFIIAVILMAPLFLSFAPSLDGRAVVAEEGTMPKGIFAKTVGYLPGDSISVSNLAKKSTVNILVIGTLDPSEGVAILLTPEAAEMLGLDKGANNVVKITKRAGELDETVSGTAVIGTEGASEVAQSDEDEDDEDDAPKEDNNVAFVDETPAAPEPAPTPEPNEDEVAENEYQEEMDGSDLAAATETPIEELAPPAKNDIAIEEPVKEVEPPATEEVKETEPVMEKIAMTSEMTKAPASEPIPEPPAPEPVVEYEPVKVNEPVVTQKSADNKVYEPVVVDKLPELKSEKTYEKVDVADLPQKSVLPEPPNQAEKVEADNFEPFAPYKDEDDSNKYEKVLSESTPFVCDVPNVCERVEVAAEPIKTEEVDAVKEDETYSAISLVETGMRPPKSGEDNNKDAAPREEKITQDIVAPADLNPQVSVVCNSAIVMVDNGSGNQTQAIIAGDAAANASDQNIEDDQNIEGDQNDAIVLQSDQNNAIELQTLPPPQDFNNIAPAAQVTEITIEQTTASDVTSDSSNDDNGAITLSEKEPATPDKKEVAPSIDVDKYKVVDIAALPKGNYVQIAVFSDDRNIESTLNKYQDNYPITLVSTKNKKATQVMIGPLASDDYGAVLLRFKDYGYKDAFLRKIK